MSIKSNLFQFWQQKELELNRRVTVSEVARATHVSRESIQRLLDNESTRFDAPVIDALCRYFDVPAGPVPFLFYEPETGENPKTGGELGKTT